MDPSGQPEDGGVDGSSSSPSLCAHTPEYSAERDRNPSPPPGKGEAVCGQEGDAIGETLYSKHWLFTTLSRLVQRVTEQERNPESVSELCEDEEEDLCKVWDMAMDKDVAILLQEFKASEILLGVIVRSQSPRLTEICVGILGNMCCFSNTCLSLSLNKELGEVLFLLLGDTDPPTLLEICRLLLTCLSHPPVAPLWLDRTRQHASLQASLCFIMNSSTNVELLLKVGELVDRLFDLDEELMTNWISADNSGMTAGITSALLEAAKQLRKDSCHGLEVYLHVLQLLTTQAEGVQALVELGEEVWSFVSAVLCEDLCQSDDPPVILQEQKSALASALALLSLLYTCREQQDSCLPLVGSLLRVFKYIHESQQKEAGSHTQPEDVQLQALMEIASDFLACILAVLSQDAASHLVRSGHLTEQSFLCAAEALTPKHNNALQHVLSLLTEEEPQLAERLREVISRQRP